MLPDLTQLLTHAEVLGTSQSGKSKFIEATIRQQIESCGPGFALVDFHGTSYHNVVDYLAYVRPSRPVVLLNPSEPDFITPYNPFVKDEGEVSAQVGRLVAALLNSWGAQNANDFPTLERVATMLFSFAIVSGEPLQHAEKLLYFNQPHLRDYAVKLLANPEMEAVRQDWLEMQSINQLREWHTHVVSTRNRIRRLLRYKGLRRFMGLKGRTLDIPKIIQEGAIVLVNLAESDYLSNEAARVFASFLLDDFFHATMKNARDPIPFVLYLDECQNYVGDAQARMLDQVLKTGMRIAFIHHHPGQFLNSPELAASLDTNAQMKVVFGGLPYEYACKYANEFFISQLNTRQIKETYYHTVNAYKKEYYTTETYSDSSSDGKSEFGYGNDENSWSGGGTNSSSGSGFSQVTGTRYAPHQFKEKTNDVEWSREEKVSRCAELLMRQPQRHCWIKPPQGEAYSFTVPKVEEYLLYPATMLEFEKDLNKDALPAAQVDRLLLEGEQQFLLQASTEHEYDGTGRPKRKKSVLSRK